MTLNVTLIPGDGIGPEVTDAARRCVTATGVDVRWDVQSAGIEAWKREGTPLPDRVLESIRTRRVALKGPISTPSGAGYRSANVRLRDELDLYAGIRPCRSLPGIQTPFPDTDVVVVRMTGEDLYAGIEYAQGSRPAKELRAWIAETDGRIVPSDAGLSIKPLSTSGAQRVVRRAFEYARSERRTKVTVVHKATVMRFTDGLFLDAAREVAAGFPGIDLDERLVDTICHDLVTKPQTLDVLVMPMLYGDIVSDLCAGLVGGLGMAPGVNLGDRCAVFEAAHGSCLRHAGRNSANPFALILSAAMLLRHVRESEAASRLTAAIEDVVCNGRSVTADLWHERGNPGAAGTDAAADAVVAALERDA